MTTNRFELRSQFKIVKCEVHGIAVFMKYDIVHREFTAYFVFHKKSRIFDYALRSVVIIKNDRNRTIRRTGNGANNFSHMPIVAYINIESQYS